MRIRTIFGGAFQKRSNLAGIIFLISALLLSGAQHVDAQSPGVSWDGPVNLSNSGSTSNPDIVTDNEGVTHVIWLDEFSGYQYTQSLSTGEWTKPVAVVFPFGTIQPQLIVGPDNTIFAFWIDERDALHSSRVLSANFSTTSAWENQGILAQNVVGYHAVTDEDRIVNLTYLTASAETASQSSGIFFRQTTPGGGVWAIATPVYSSLYYRGMTAEQAHLNIAVLGVNDTKNIIIAWDDPFLKKIILYQSEGQGISWIALPEITSLSGSSTPAMINLASWNGEMVAVWQDAVTEKNCSIWYQVYTAENDRWSIPQALLSDQSSCPSASNFVANQADLLIWQVNINNQVLLYAWDGNRWSDPQTQAELSGFRDPASLRSLSAGCLQMASAPTADRLAAVVCDSNGNMDIWGNSREIGAVSDWFTDTIEWGKTAELARSLITHEAVEIQTVADSAGNIHAFWTELSVQTDDQSNRSKRVSIFYSKWALGNWIDPVEIRRVDSGIVHRLQSAISSQDNLYVTWQGENQGEIYLFRVQASRANSPAEWIRAIVLPKVSSTIGEHDITIGAQEEIYVTYAIPFNEERGIYLIRSEDGGENWEQPVRIFNAQAAGWEMVDEPEIIVSNDGRLHVLWRQETPLQTKKGLGLGYAYSDDGGLTWSEPDLTATGEAIVWAGMTPMGSGQIFRVWQKIENNQSVTYSQISNDNGLSWSSPFSIAGFGNWIGEPDLFSSIAGEVHLLQIIQSSSAMSETLLGDYSLRHWIWIDGNWMAGDNLDLSRETIRSIDALSGSISALDQIAVVFSLTNFPDTHQSVQAIINYQGSQVQSVVDAPQTTPQATQRAEPTASLPSSTPTDEPAPQTGVSTIDPTPSRQPEQTPTIDFSNEAGPVTSNSWAGVVLGGVLGGVIVIVAIGYRILISRKDNRKGK